MKDVWRMNEGWMKDEWRMNEGWMKDEWRMNDEYVAVISTVLNFTNTELECFNHRDEIDEPFMQKSTDSNIILKQKKSIFC